MRGLVHAARRLLGLYLKNELFEVWRCLQRKHGCIRVIGIGLKRERDALAVEGVGVGLDLHVLLEQAVYGLLRLGDAVFERR